MTIKEFIENNVAKGSKTTVLAVTEPKMNKRGNDYYGRVKKYTVYNGVTLGAKYESKVEGAMERSGSTESNFVVGALKGTHYLNDFFNESDREEGKLYLKLQWTAKEKSDGDFSTKSVFYVDGREATEEEIKVFTTFMPKPRVASTQLESGVSLENAVSYRNIKVENIVAVKYGENAWTNDEIDSYGTDKVLL